MFDSCGFLLLVKLDTDQGNIKEGDLHQFFPQQKLVTL